MQKTLLHIPKMDCPSEERMVRLALESNKEISDLFVDFSTRSLTVIHRSEVSTILAALEPLNYGTKLQSTEFLEGPVGINHLTNDPEKEAKVLKTLFLINGVMFIVELITGLLADSIGLIADSLDMLADASVYLISLYAVGKALSVKKQSAIINGIFQIILASGVLFETVRRFYFGSDPEPTYMTGVSIVALLANVYCLYLLSGHKDRGVHLKASYICSSSDVMANAGVILAAGLVYLTNSPYPDLAIGFIVTGIVLRGGVSILKIAK